MPTGAPSPPPLDTFQSPGTLHPAEDCAGLGSAGTGGTGQHKKPQGAEAKALVQGVTAKTCFRGRLGCQRGLRLSGIPRRVLRLRPSWSAGHMLRESG